MGGWEYQGSKNWCGKIQGGKDGKDLVGKKTQGEKNGVRKDCGGKYRRGETVGEKEGWERTGEEKPSTERLP